MVGERRGELKSSRLVLKLEDSYEISSFKGRPDEFHAICSTAACVRKHKGHSLARNFSLQKSDRRGMHGGREHGLPSTGGPARPAIKASSPNFST